MPVYKDNNKKGSWFISCYYTDYLGHKKQKVKRGFKTKKDAQAWERDFLDRQCTQPTILFKNFIDVYMEDYKTRFKPASYYIKMTRVNCHILPYFGDTPINKITPNMIREWQHKLQSIQGMELKTATKNTLLRTLSSIFAYACKYYNLEQNPCKSVDSLKDNTKADRAFLTLDQYKAFRAVINDIRDLTMFDLLFYTGVRRGELLALTLSDIDFNNKLLHINKTIGYARGGCVITPPKTTASIRDITLPGFLIDELKEYMAHCYDKSPNARLFHMNISNVRLIKDKYLRLAKLPPVRVHDFRHSHVALLVELGENPLLIANRLGHSDIKMTLNTYAHLYPNKQKELADKLENL
jgi:phage integrase